MYIHYNSASDDPIMTKLGILIQHTCVHVLSICLVNQEVYYYTCKLKKNTQKTHIFIQKMLNFDYVFIKNQLINQSFLSNLVGLTHKFSKETIIQQFILFQLYFPLSASHYHDAKCIQLRYFYVYYQYCSNCQLSQKVTFSTNSEFSIWILRLQFKLKNHNLQFQSQETRMSSIKYKSNFKYFFFQICSCR